MAVGRQPEATPVPSEQRLFQMEILISRVLQVGVLLSAAIIALGLVWLLLVHRTGYPAQGFPRTLGGVWQGVESGRPYAVIALGLLVLILTPVIRVAVAVGTFLVEGDRLYVVTTLFVLCMLIFGFVLGTVLR